MELLERITKKRNRYKLYLLIISFLVIFGVSYLFFNNNLTNNQKILFSKIDNLSPMNSFQKVSEDLDIEPKSDLCINNDKVITCNKIKYNSYLGFGKYNLEFEEVNNKVSYKISENNKSIFLIIFEMTLLLSISLFLTYYFLKLFYFIKDKFNPYLQDEYVLVREEWSKIQKSKIELEELLSNGDKSVKEKLRELRDKEKKLEEEYKKLKDKEKKEFKEVKDDWMETKEFSSDERKKIYRKLSKYFHPDSGNILDDESFKNINEAYSNKDDNILFDYYKEYLEHIGEEENIFGKQSITEKMVLVELINLGLNPRPQYQISNMHVDIAFPKYKLVVEIDGPEHNTEKGREQDRKRDLYLHKTGWVVKRYKNYKTLSKDDLNKLTKEIARKVKRELIKLKK